MVAIPINKSAGVIDDAFKEVEENQEVLVVIDLIWLLLPTLYFVLYLEQLGPDVFESCNVRGDCPYRFIHLYYLFEHKFFLSLLHESHDLRAIKNEVLLVLVFKLFGLFEVVQLHLKKLDLLKDVLQLSLRH